LWIKVQSHTGTENLGRGGIQYGFGTIYVFGGICDRPLTRRDMVVVQIGHDTHAGILQVSQTDKT
jgi:hypothetical protein